MREGESLYFRLPGTRGSIPLFVGGPLLHVKVGAHEVALQPVLYGPSAYFGSNGSQSAKALIDKVLIRVTEGNARPWLLKIYADFEGDVTPT